MVTHENESSVSEDDGESELLNENGKRLSESCNKEGKKRFKTKSLYRRPTVSELNRLQETESLFNSNLFRLQVEEVLKEVKVKEKTEKKFQKWFNEFKSYLESITEDNIEYDLTEKKFVKKLNVKLPVCKDLSKTRCVFKFYKFKSAEIVSSYELGCAINSNLVVDLQITVPAETYVKNDTVNYRYHKKRAAYLAYIASHLTQLEIIDELKYTWLNSCETRPVLDIKPSGKLGKNLSVRLNLTCEAETYKLHRFSPNRNNLREAWLFSTDGQEGTDVGLSTPYYNSTVLCDVTATENWEFLKAVLLKSDNLKQAIVLLKIWLRQRKLQVSGHLIALLVAYLVQTKRINNIMSSYQIIRNVWISLKISEWDVKGISLHKGDDSPPLEEFHKHFPVVFLDKTGYYNICWQMCKGTYHALRRESALAVEMLDNGKLNSFIPLFMSPVQPLMRFDQILRFKDLPKIKETVLSRASTASRLNYGVDRLALVTDTLHSLLAKALGDRVNLIQQMVEADFSWSVKKTPRKVKEKLNYIEKLSFGFILNPENAFNPVEKGPPANLPEAEEFRAFWGDKSELRRFQDGSITETCVWLGDSQVQRRTITSQIIDYIMQLKYDVTSSEVFHVCSQLDTLLYRKQYGGAPIEELSLKVLHAFDELRRDLRSLANLPLNISAVYGTSPVFSYSDPAVGAAQQLGPRGGPRSGPQRGPRGGPQRRASAALIAEGRPVCPPYKPVNKAILELGYSGKWPGDLEAFRCLKAAFNLQIAENLTKQYSVPTQAYPTHIDVLKNGLVFRLEIAHPKEIILLRREVENGIVKHKETEESVNLERDTVLLPRLRGALHGLQQKHPSLGAASCLLGRWLSSQLLSPPAFPAAAAELLVAAAFCRSAPLTPSAQPLPAFLRALQLLARPDRSTDAIVLDFNDDMTHEEMTEVEQQLSSSGQCLPLASSLDGARPGLWAQSVCPRTLARVGALAAAALARAEEALLHNYEEHLLSIFVPSLSGYDVLIRLRPGLVPLAAERLDRPPEHVSQSADVEDDLIPVVEFNPVLNYLDELRSAYGDFALFFHDMYGGDVIAVLWKPDISEPREFQVSTVAALKPVVIEGESMYIVNKEAIVEDFRIMGDGLVESITVC